MTDMAPADDDDQGVPKTMGRKLQELLGELTGRKTVPNVMLGLKSIGGSDDVAKMDAEDTLAEMIRSSGGGRIVLAKKRTREGEENEDITGT